MKVEIKRVSKRPQRYETCILKEGDLEIVREDLDQFQRPPRVPARVVLNNQTISVFQTANYDTILFSCELPNVELSKFGEETSCFQITNALSGVHVALCSMGTIMGITMEQLRNEWVKAIQFFKDYCHE